MMPDDRIAEVLEAAPTLDAAAERLVREANEAGGRDNITVVAFRLAEAAPPRTEEGATLVGPAAEEAGLTAEGVRPPPGAAGRGARRRGEPRPERPRRCRRRAALKVLAAVALTVGLAVVAVWGARQIYFLGSDSGGRLALYRGLPYDLPLDIKLYSEVYAAPVQVELDPE